MTRGGAHAAQARAESLLFGIPVVESVLASLDTGAAPELEPLLDELVAEVCAAREPDGSWQGSACRTAERLLLLAELARTPASRARPRSSVEWLIQRQGRMPDGEWCSDELHALQVCSHATPTFAAIASTRLDLAPLRLQHGAAFMSDVDARAAVTGLATAALLSWNAPRGATEPPLDALIRLVSADEHRRTQALSANGLACLALALVPAASLRSDAMAALGRTVLGLARAQRADGSWASGDLFFVLSVLVRLSAVAELHGLVQRQLRRSAELLVLLQQPDGNWSRSDTWPLLIGWRTLRSVTAAAASGEAEG
jgi:hypothetical protein